MKHAVQKGFTLVELMIVVVIIGVIASIALPSYFEQAQKARRAEAQANLVELASYMERTYTESNSYASATISDSGITNDNYTFTSPIPNLAATTYTLTAIPIVNGSQAEDRCGTMTLTQAGATGAAGTSCW